MKNLRLLFCLLFVPQAALFAQTNFPFPDADAVWSVCAKTQYWFDTYADNHKYTVMGDSVLNGIVYKKYYHCPDSILNPNQLSFYALLREDTQAQHSYVVYNGEATEQLLYDFSFAVGDTLLDSIYYSGWWFITEPIVVTQITFDSEGRKQIHLNTWNNEVWIEGIGSTQGLFNRTHQPLLDEPELELLCFEQSGELIYQKYEGQCYYQNITGIEKPAKQAFNVAINAGNNQLFVGSPLSEQATLALYDVLGRLVLQQTLSPNSTTVGIEQLPAAVYLYQISYQKQTLQRGKVSVAR